MRGFWLILLAWGMAVGAAEVPIYSGTSVLSSEGDIELAQGQQRALQQVLVKASGDASVASDPALGGKLARAARLELQHRLETPTPPANGDAAAQRLRLVADFDPVGVQKLLSELGRPLWGAERPTVLVWLVIDNLGSQQIASAFQTSALDALIDTAAARGLPIQLPRMDGVDRNRIDPVTLWDATPNLVIGASQRYEARVILVARLKKAAGSWSARYTLIDGRQFEHWQANAGTAAELLATAITDSADRLARRYAVESGAAALGKIVAQIEALDSAADYAKVMRYFGQLPAVRSVETIGAVGNRLQLQLDVAVGLRRLQQLLVIDQILQFVAATPPPTTATAAAAGAAAADAPAALQLRLIH